jgi:hypothetical protein
MQGRKVCKESKESKDITFKDVELWLEDLPS